jgi:hypothetical protein
MNAIVVRGDWARELDAGATVRGLCIKQPWLGRIATGRKTIEVRSWSTNHRGPLICCASAAPARGVRLDAIDNAATERDADAYARGSAVCVVDVIDVTPFERKHERASMVRLDDLDGPHFAWHVRLIERLTPSPVSGKVGFLRMPVAIAA